MTWVLLPGQSSYSRSYEHCIISPMTKTPKLYLLPLGSRKQQGQNHESWLTPLGSPQRSEPGTEKCDSKAEIGCQSRGSESGLRKPLGNGDRCWKDQNRVVGVVEADV